MMREEEVRIGNGEFTLAGTLTRGDLDCDTAVLCIHGTGPMDRDENAGAQRLDVFNRIAEALAEEGVACLRYDKRGIGKSEGDYMTASHRDLVSDAGACRDWLRERFARVILLGHSEGTVIAPQLAEGADALVLVCPFVTPLREILRNQARELDRAQAEIPGWKGVLTRGLTRLFGGNLRAQARFIRRIERSRKPVLRVMRQEVPVASLRELLALDIEGFYRGLDLPVLLVVAGKDAQCPPEDGARIKAMLGEAATLWEFPDLSHLLRNQAGPAGFAGYGEQLERPMEPMIASRIAGWCAENAKTVPEN